MNDGDLIKRPKDSNPSIDFVSISYQPSALQL